MAFELELKKVYFLHFLKLIRDFVFHIGFVFPITFFKTYQTHTLHKINNLHNREDYLNAEIYSYGF